MHLLLLDARWLDSSCSLDLVDITHQFLLLHVSGKFEIVDVLLGLDQDLLKLHVELISLLKKD